MKQDKNAKHTYLRENISCETSRFYHEKHIEPTSNCHRNCIKDRPRRNKIARYDIRVFKQGIISKKKVPSDKTITEHQSQKIEQVLSKIRLFD